MATNLALHRPALQTSVSRWSSAATAAEDACVATDGDTASPRFFCTDHEASPWWQVDLGAACMVEGLRIFNRVPHHNRLMRFSVLVSMTGADWMPVWREFDAAFVDALDTPLAVTLASPSLARFVRIRKDDPGYLHLRECEVFGRSATSDETASAAANAALGHRLVEEGRMADRALVDGRTGMIAQIDGLRVFVDTVAYSPTLVAALTGGSYEVTERRLVRRLIGPDDRVLEIGTAIGLVAMTLATLVGPSNVMTYDANPAMVDDARRNFAANRLERIDGRLGVLRNRARWREDEAVVPFYVSRDFWTSRLAAAGASDIVGVVQVPLVCLETAIADHRATVLVCDIEGGEADLLEDADLAGIRLVVVEVHDWAVGRSRTGAMMRWLIQAGFDVDFTHSGEGVAVLGRSE
jgi:FkbM family methyltransferase